MAQWRSDVLPWLAIGGAVGVSWLISVTDNASAPRVRNNVYATQEACERDYQPEQCVQTYHAYSAGHGGGYYAVYGPSYYTRDAPAGDPGPGRTALTSGDGRSSAATSVSESVARGGFGSTARGGGRSYGG